MPLVRNTNPKPQLHEFNNVSPQRVALTNGFDFQYAVSYYRFTAGGNIFAKNKGYLTASVHSFATSVAHMYSPDVTSRSF